MYFAHYIVYKHELLNVIAVVCVKLYYKTLNLKIYILFNKMRFSNVRLDKIYTFKIKSKLSCNISLQYIKYYNLIGTQNFARACNIRTFLNYNMSYHACFHI